LRTYISYELLSHALPLLSPLLELDRFLSPLLPSGWISSFLSSDG
jgi:hypothetical protein